MAHLNFSDYVDITCPALSPSPETTQGQYVAYFCCLLISGKWFEKVDLAPLRICKMKDDSDRAKFYRGDRELTKKDSLHIYRNWTDTHLISHIMSAPTEARYDMFDRFESKGMTFPDDDEENKAQVIADNLKNLIQDLARRRNSRTTRTASYSLEDVEEKCYYSQEHGILRIGEREVKIDPIIAPEVVATEEEDKLYIKALLEVFAALLGEDVSSIRELQGADANFYKELLEHRESFYSAESIKHIVRDAFSDGSEYFDSYKEELYQGVIVVHRRSYPDGYERLQAVLGMSTSMVLSRQKLERLYIIGAKEKKGICHMLVEEGKITSWMKRF